MDEQTISNALKALPVPDSRTAQMRAADEAAALVRHRPRRWRAGVVAVVAAFLLALTPPVQSLAESLGELVGIGDEPSDTFPSGKGSVTDGRQVIAVGETPSGEQVELAVQAEHGPGGKGTLICQYLSFPSAEIEPISERCSSPSNLEAGPPINPSASIGPDELGADQDLIIDVLSRPPTTDVAVEYTLDGTRRQAEALGGTFDPSRLAEESETGAGTVRLSVALLPSRILGAPDPYEGRPPDALDAEEQAEAIAELDRVKDGLKNIEIVATDAAGAEVYRERLSDVSNALADSLALGR